MAARPSPSPSQREHAMKLTMRKYRDDHDYWRIRQFLRDVLVLNDRREICWPPYRWDYWRWHVSEHICRFSLRAAVFLWEASDGQLAAVLHPDGPGEAVMQIHPALRSPELEVELIGVAETQFATTQATGGQQLTLWAHESDLLRQDVLRRRGYTRSGRAASQRRRWLDAPIPASPAPAGYTLRPLGDEAEHPARSRLAWQALHPAEPDAHDQGGQWYRSLQHAPLYRHDLDLVAVAPAGELAAGCTLWLDDVTRSAAFAPLLVHPAHQRRGLARALLAEGMRRARDLGATLCTLESSAAAADACAASLGFTDYDLRKQWRKQW